MRFLVGSALASLVVALSPHARAQEGPYSNFIVGERALGFAGAYVAVADDPSAGFHNPAGLGPQRHSSFAGSLLAIVWENRSIDDGYRTPIGSAKLDHAELPSLPLYVGGVLKLGKRRRDGVAPHSFGASLISPYRNEFRYIVQLEDPMIPAADRLEVRHSDSSKWIGLSYAYRLNENVSLGFSTFYANRHVRHDEVAVRAQEGVPDDLVARANASRTMNIRAGAEHIVFRVGVLANLQDDLRLGVMFQPPTVQLDAVGSYDGLTTMLEPGLASFTAIAADPVPANLPLPWDLRVGIAWLDDDPSLTLTLDLSVIGPWGDQNVEKALLVRDPADPPLAFFVPEVTYRRLGFRSAGGFEIVPLPELPIRGGLLFERSSAPGIPATSDVYARSRMHTVGGALAVGLRASGFDVSIGVTGLYSFGEGLGVEHGAAGEPPSYSRRDTRKTTVLVFLSGARNAVGRLVEEIRSDSSKPKSKSK
jgi:long-subunit fatty acid transport protein